MDAPERDDVVAVVERMKIGELFGTFAIAFK